MFPLQKKIQKRFSHTNHLNNVLDTYYICTYLSRKSGFSKMGPFLKCTRFKTLVEIWYLCIQNNEETWRNTQIVFYFLLYLSLTCTFPDPVQVWVFVYIWGRPWWLWRLQLHLSELLSPILCKQLSYWLDYLQLKK